MHMLEPLGLSPVAESVYRTMLQHRDWGVLQIAEHLELGRGQVRSALDQLSELALLTPPRHLGDSGWQPVNPSVALSALLARAEAEVLARRQQIDATRSAIVALSTLEAMAPGEEAAARLEGADAVRGRMQELATTVVNSCLSMNPNSAQTPEAKRASRPLNEQLLRRGVSIRCIYQESFRNDPSLLRYARWLASAGGETRTIPIVPILLVIYDRTTVLVPIDPADTGRGALEVRSPGLVAMACALFDQLWAAAVPFGAPPQGEADLGPTQRQLLALLAAGHTDELAARRLGVSLSTVRRLMATLMEQLSARSRFQAGIHAARRGWLDGPAELS
jgi:DNA-binding CsgD family transcriptional regulator